jgi:hypothetical protein
MKCPKCGYNSFEFHDSCTKCSQDLTEYKQSYGLGTIVLPQAARTVMAESLASDSLTQTPGDEKGMAAPEEMFSFDLPDAEPTAAPATTSVRDPFSFDNETAVEPPQKPEDFSFDDGEQSAQARAEEDAFASLLETTSPDSPKSVPESTPQESADVFADAFADLADTPAAEVPEPVAATPDSSGEFELENFSWDDTPVSGTDESPKSPDNDFESLFGDTDDTKK